MTEILDPLWGSPMKLQLEDKGWMDRPITLTPKVGNTEIWQLINTTGDTHPMHLHLVQFQVVDRQKFDVAQYLANGNVLAPTLVGPPKPPAAWDAGWEDTIQVNPGEVVRIIATFDHARDVPDPLSHPRARGERHDAAVPGAAVADEKLGEDPAPDLPERLPAQHDLVAVLQERPFVHVELDQAAAFALAGPGDRPVARRSPHAQARAVRRQVRDLLGDVPVEVASRSCVNDPPVQLDLERDVVDEVAVRRCSSGSGSCVEPGTRVNSSSVVTHGEIDVAKDLPRNGPSGTYSKAWMSRRSSR